MTGLKVGITVSPQITDLGAALWINGVHQNVFYLALLLQRLREVAEVSLVSSAGGEHPMATAAGLPTLNVADAADRLDILIELGLRCDAADMRRFRARGGKLVSYIAGNAMVMNLEAVASGLGQGEILSESGFDAVWITPQHWQTNHAYAALTRSPNVQLAPHIWHPWALMQSAFHHRANPWWRPGETAKGWRVGVFDPNVNVVKTFHMPLLVCEEAERRRPDAIKSVLLFSTARMTGNQHFKELTGALDLKRRGKLFAEERQPLVKMMGAHVDAVVTHHWENGLNYLYWDVLYLGWPLIHNAEAIADVGYFYPAFDTHAGGEALCDAFDRHAAAGPRERQAVLDALWAYHIDNPVVQARHAELLSQVMN